MRVETVILPGRFAKVQCDGRTVARLNYQTNGRTWATDNGAGLSAEMDVAAGEAWFARRAALAALVGA